MKSDDFPPDEVRSPHDVARRTLALFGVWGLAVSPARDEVLRWLEEHNLREALSPDELKFVDTEHPSSKQRIDFSWHSERLIVLIWALNLIDGLPGADEQCDTSVFRRYLPPLAGQSVEQFVSGATLRSEDELWEQVERMRELHWKARDGALNNRPPSEPVDIEVIQERHHAINWVTGYCGLDWDDVTTDT